MKLGIIAPKVFMHKILLGAIPIPNWHPSFILKKAFATDYPSRQKFLCAKTFTLNMVAPEIFEGASFAPQKFFAKLST
jgi:hypothetical protein